MTSDEQRKADNNNDDVGKQPFECNLLTLNRERRKVIIYLYRVIVMMMRRLRISEGCNVFVSLMLETPTRVSQLRLTRVFMLQDLN